MNHHHNHHNHHSGTNHSGHDPNEFKRLFLVSLVLTLPTLVFSHAIQEWFTFDISFAFSNYIPMFFGIIIYAYGGKVFLKGAVTEIKSRSPGMMTLVAMAITVAFLYSVFVTLGIVNGMDFWWELATLVTIMLLGHWLEMASINSAQGALKELAKLLPDTAERIIGGKAEKVSVSLLQVNDIILVRPGSKIPADAVVIEGESHVDEAMLTGESTPVKKQVHTEVIAGTVNGNGAIKARVTKIGDDTALAGIMRLVSQAQNGRSKTQVLADKVAYYLTFAAIGVAILTACGWFFAGESTAFIIERVVTVLVIACPHALGLAIPLVVSIATTIAAKQGILLRKREALEEIKNVNAVIFDKTGTLTQGKQQVVHVFSDDDEMAVLTKAASVEQASEHSIASAIMQYAKQKNIATTNTESFTAVPGKGAWAMVANEKIYVGSSQYANENNAVVSDTVRAALQKNGESYYTAIYVFTTGRVIGVIMLADEVRDTSAQTVRTLKDLGVTSVLLTGDSENVAASVAKTLGIKEYYAEVLPRQKMDIVKTLQQKYGRVAMVGDGINDAPALLQASVGVAIGAGTDVAIESADIVLVRDNPADVVSMIRLSKATYRKMRQNIAWAVGYNIIAIPLAAGVLAPFGFTLSPAIGAVLMSFSTIIVALNAQLLRRFKE